jgi:hypothetical protein
MRITIRYSEDRLTFLETKGFGTITSNQAVAELSAGLIFGIFESFGKRSVSYLSGHFFDRKFKDGTKAAQQSRQIYVLTLRSNEFGNGFQNFIEPNLISFHVLVSVFKFTMPLKN